MNFRNFPRFVASLVCAIPLILTVPAQAQEEEEDLGSLVKKSMDIMKLNKWEEALAISNKIIEKFGKKDPLGRYGARFGTIYYRKGLCELKLKKWSEAASSFETCYKDFPNKGTEVGNDLNKKALLKWGDAALGAGEWELALTQYQKFLKERDPKRDSYPKGTFHIGLAVCHYQLGRLPEGNENLEIAIKNKLTFPTSDSGIVAGFQALVSGAILKQNEQALLDFIAKNRGELAIEPYLMQQYSRVFMKLAADAGNVGMERATMALYQFVPATGIALEDVKTRLRTINGMAGVKDGSNLLFAKKLEEASATLEAEKKGKRSNEMVKLEAVAYLHEKNGNLRGAFAAYKQLESFYPSAEKREDNLYNLVRTSSLVAKGIDTQRYAELFIKTFPDSKHVPAVRRLMLSVLFYDGEYELCIEVAEPMINTLPPKTPEHDICLHVLGGSYFYTGQYDKAQPLLEKHVADYPESLFVIAANYFVASNLVRLQFWSKAATLMDTFLTTYPDASKNVFLPFALYDRATCHFAEEQNDQALVKLERIINEFQSSNVIEQAYNLKGNIEQSLKNSESAEKSYLAALEIAEKRQNRIIAGESLYSLVALIGEKKAGKEENPRYQEAVTYADKYWKEYAENSPYKARVAVAQVPALNAVGRGEGALERLNEVIVEMAKDPEARGLEELINSYTGAYLEKHTPEELKEHYYNFKGIRAKDLAARALLQVAVIGVFEGIAKTSEDEEKKRSASAMIKVLFQQLKVDFDVKVLTNFILVKVGDFLRNTATPREALPFYDEALGRQDQSYRFPALLGRADVYGKSALPADIDKGIEDFTRVYTDSQEKPEKEFSLYRIIELHMAKKDYAKAADQAVIYLDREKTGFAKFSPKVGLLLAKSYEERNQLDDALAMYIKVWSAHMGDIQISAPAMLSWMQLSWDRNKPAASPADASDRQGAYNGGANYIQLTGRFKDKMTESDRELWNEVEKLVQQYEADPEVKNVEELKIEKEKAKKR